MKLKLTLVFIGFFLLSLAAPQQAHAQFWKKWFGHEDEPRHKPKPHHEPIKDLAPLPKPKPKKHSNTVEYPATVMKSRYRIDLLAPLYLDELVKNNKPVYKDRIPEKALAGLNFYEGVKLAADTLTRLGYHVDVFVHDVMDSSLSLTALLKGNDLKSSDLIIGAVPTGQLTALASFARENHINFISALSPSDADVADNAYFTLLQPTLETHCEKIRDVAIKKYSERNILLFYRTSVAVDSMAYRYTLGSYEGTFRKLSCNGIPMRQRLLKLLDSTEVNVILMPVLDYSYADELIKQLNTLFPTYKFDIYGMPSWKAMTSLKKADAYPNIAVNFTEPFYFDMSTASSQSLMSAYSREFGGRPGEMVFRGYETMFWYAYLLNRYGNIYNPKQGDNGGAIFTRFDVKPRWTENGDLLYNENQHLYIYRYQAGSFVIEQ